MKRFLAKMPHKLKYKILLAYLLPSIGIVCFLTMTAYFVGAHLMENQLLTSASDTIRQTENSLLSFINKYDALTLSYSFSGSVQDLLGQDLSYYNINQQKNDKLDLETELYSSIPTRLENSNSTCSIRLYFNDSFPYFTNHTQYFNYQDASGEAWWQKIIEGYRRNRSSFYFISPEENAASSYAKDSFSLARVIVDTNYYPNPLAVLVLDFPRSYLDSSIRNTNVEGIFNFVTTQDGQLLACSDPESYPFYESGLVSASDSHAMKDSWNEITISHTRYLTKAVPLGSYGLQLTTVIPYHTVIKDISILRNSMLCIGLLMAVVCIFFANATASNITRRLSYVNDKMREVRTGRLTPLTHPLSPSSWDEIDELMDTYNYMIGEMEILIVSQYQNGREIKNMELKALQAQINPHFLYNALDLIHWFAEEDMMDEINAAVSSLAAFYRISLSNGREQILLKDELNHVEAYVRLQNLRFENTIHYECLVEERFLNLTVIKMILQPLVENAIQHGLFEKDEMGGSITIRSWQETPEKLFLIVSDDGVGMTSQQVECLNQNNMQTSDADHGYGIQNVNSRLLLSYGADYQLYYESAPGAGTKVYVRIPIIRQS